MEDLIQTFIQLVKIDSPTGEEDTIISFLNTFAQKWKQEAYRDMYGNLIIKTKGVGKPLFLSAHVDTVEPGRGIQPIVSDTHIKTDGTTILGGDNKIGVAILVEMIKRIAESKVEARPLEIAFVRSEEIGNYGAINLDYSKINAKEGYIMDYAGSVGTIITASPFYNRLDVTINGKATHASKPHLGINALALFIEAMKHISLGKVNEKTLVNIGVIKSGFVRNTVPGTVEIQGEVRSFVEDDVETYANNLIKEFQKVAKKYKGSISSSVVRENPGYEYAEHEPFIQETKKRMNICSITPQLEIAWGCSDANIFREHGITTLNLGNGGTGAHTTEESIELAQFQKLYTLMMGLISYK